jgi:hypothetical protein
MVATSCYGKVKESKRALELVMKCSAPRPAKQKSKTRLPRVREGSRYLAPNHEELSNRILPSNFHSRWKLLEY